MVGIGPPKSSSTVTMTACAISLVPSVTGAAPAVALGTCLAATVGAAKVGAEAEALFAVFDPDVKEEAAAPGAEASAGRSAFQAAPRPARVSTKPKATLNHNFVRGREAGPEARPELAEGVRLGRGRRFGLLMASWVSLA